MNVVFFVCPGMLLPLMYEKIDFKGTVLCGFSLSLLIELGRLFNSRSTDIDDLIMNTLGALIGYALWRLLFKNVRGLQIEGGTGVAPGAVGTLYGVYFLVGAWIVCSVWAAIYTA